MPANSEEQKNIAGEPSRTPDRGESGHPRETYQTPADVVGDNKLSRQEKIDILQNWKADVEARLGAQNEGMGGSAPISAEKEAKLANEERLANQAIADLKEEKLKKA